MSDIKQAKIPIKDLRLRIVPSSYKKLGYHIFKEDSSILNTVKLVINYVVFTALPRSRSRNYLDINLNRN